MAESEASMSNVDVEEEYQKDWRDPWYWVPFYSSTGGGFLPRRKLFYIVWLFWAINTGFRTREVTYVSQADVGTIRYSLPDTYFDPSMFLFGLLLTYPLTLGVFMLGGWVKRQMVRAAAAVRSSVSR